MSFILSETILFNEDLNVLPSKKLLINTINAYSYNIAQKDELFAKALRSSDVLLPDGVSIVHAMRFLKKGRIKKIAGADLFYYEMEKLNQFGGKCFFLGSSIETLNLIIAHAKDKYPKVIVECYSPPFVKEFSEDETKDMVMAVNSFVPDVLFIGMTAPKQEKWAFEQFDKLNVGHVCSIGAVFDFFAGNIKRAPQWMINSGFEWFYRLASEPKRMWRRYILGNVEFIAFILKERFIRSENIFEKSL